MTTEITKLVPLDHIAHDPQPIARIYREMDTQSAEKVVNRALGELALSVASLSREVTARDVTDAPRQLRRIARMAEHLGMNTLSHTSLAAEACLEDYDATAFAAVWARLLRVAGSQLAMGEQLQGARG